MSSALTAREARDRLAETKRTAATDELLAQTGPRRAAAPRWLRDDESNHCFGCNREFDSVRRRHHCRRCGLLYCDACSARRALIHPAEAVFPPDWDSMLSSFDPREPLRVCDGCFRVLAPQQDALAKTTAHAAQPTEVDRDAYERYLNAPIQFDLRSEIQKATHTLLNFCEDNAIEGSDSVPRELIASAWGLAFVTTMQAGFFFSGRMGSGLVIARTPDGGWSAPSAVCTAGAGWGLQIGGEVTDMLIVLNSQDAVDAFASTAQLSLGTELSLALGPMGRSAETNMTAGDGGVSAVFSYAHSKGFFVGIALHACVILARPDCNEKFYGRRFDTAHILSGAVDRPLGAEPLYKALEEVMRDDVAAAKGTTSASSRKDASIGADAGPPPQGGRPTHVVEAAYPPSSPPPPVEDVAVSGVRVRVKDGDPRRFVDDHVPRDPHAPVRAAPLTAEEQEQIDADLALAIALRDEEESAAAARARAEAEARKRKQQQESSWWDWGSSSSGSTTTSREAAHQHTPQTDPRIYAAYRDRDRPGPDPHLYAQQQTLQQQPSNPRAYAQARSYQADAARPPRQTTLAASSAASAPSSSSYSSWFFSSPAPPAPRDYSNDDWDRERMERLASSAYEPDPHRGFGAGGEELKPIRRASRIPPPRVEAYPTDDDAYHDDEEVTL